MVFHLHFGLSGLSGNSNGGPVWWHKVGDKQCNQCMKTTQSQQTRKEHVTDIYNNKQDKIKLR